MKVLLVCRRSWEGVLLGELLKKYELRCCNTGSAAVDLFNQDKPDLVISFFKMTDLNLIDFMEKVFIAGQADRPIICLADDSDTPTFVRVRQLSMRGKVHFFDMIRVKSLPRLVKKIFPAKIKKARLRSGRSRSKEVKK